MSIIHDIILHVVFVDQIWMALAKIATRVRAAKANKWRPTEV